MRCLICGDADVEWVTTHMFNEDEGYEEYSCHICGGRSEYGISTKNREYNGKNDVVPFPFKVE